MFGKSLISSLIAGAALAFVSAAGAEQPIRIGYSIAKTGMFAVATPVQTQAYELWRDQINAGGGLAIAGQGKRKVEFVVYDDQSEPSKAAQIYERLITSDKVDLLLAPWGTATHIGIAPVVQKHRFPVVGNTAASTLVRDLGITYMWFFEPLPDQYGPQLAKLLTTIGLKRAAVITMQLPFALETKKFLIPALEKAGIAVVLNQEYPPDIKDMTGLLSAVKAANPDAVLGLSYPGDSIVYMSTARELGLTAPFQFLEVGPTEPFFVTKFGANLEGIITLGHWSPDQAKWPKAKPFFDAYKAKFKEAPDYFDSVSSYASAEILAEAVAKVGLNREKLRETIATGTFETINGTVKFNGVTNVATPSGVIQMQKGVAQIIWPPEIATSKFEPKAPWK